MARQGQAWQGEARPGGARQGGAGHGKARLGGARQGQARLGGVGLGKAGHGKARRGEARQGVARSAFEIMKCRWLDGERTVAVKAKTKLQLTKFEQPPDFQEKVDKAKATLSSLSLSELSLRFRENVLLKEANSAAEKELNVKREALNQVLLDLLAADGLKKIGTDFGATLYVKEDPYFPIEDKAAVNAWIRREGLDDLFTVNSHTLSALVKERLADGEAPPPGIGLFLKRSIGHNGIK